MAKLPPTPVGVPPGHSYWNDWYEKLRDFIDNAVQFFSDLDFTGSNITSIATRNHNDLQNFQGGTSAEYYHLTNTQHTALTAGFTGTGAIVRELGPVINGGTIGVTTQPTTIRGSDLQSGLGAAATPSHTFINDPDTGMYRVSANVVGLAAGGGNALSASNTGAVFPGTVEVNGGATILRTTNALTNGAGAGAGTLGNAPTAGNPTKWIAINDAGTTRYIPTWT